MLPMQQIFPKLSGRLLYVVSHNLESQNAGQRAYIKTDQRVTFCEKILQPPLTKMYFGLMVGKCSKMCVLAIFSNFCTYCQTEQVKR